MSGLRATTWQSIGSFEPDRPTAAAAILAVVGWSFSLADLNNAVPTLVAAGSTLVLGYVGWTGILAKKRRENRREEFDLELEERKRTDEANRDSLTARLDEMTKQAERIARESKENQERMRKSLHDVRNQLQAQILENHAVQENLRIANRNFIDVSRELNEANKRIAELTAEVTRLNADERTRFKNLETAIRQSGSGIFPAVIVNPVVKPEEKP